MERATEDPLGALTAAVAVLTLPVGIVTGLFVGSRAAAVFVDGWFLLVPVIPLAGKELLPAFGIGVGERGESVDPLAELRERYARGEIDDEEFERRVERLVPTEDLDRVDGREADSDPGDRERIRER